MLNFDFFEKCLGKVSPSHLCIKKKKKYFSSYILLTDQVLLSDCHYLLRYW